MFEKVNADLIYISEKENADFSIKEENLYLTEIYEKSLHN